jgi:hypothetical protein
MGKRKESKIQNRRDKPIKLPAGRFEEVLKAALSTPPIPKKKTKSRGKRQ